MKDSYLLPKKRVTADRSLKSSSEMDGDSSAEEQTCPLEDSCSVKPPSNHPVVETLRAQLSELGLETRGKRQELQKRLRRALKARAFSHKSTRTDGGADGGDITGEFVDPWKLEDNDGASWEKQEDGPGQPKHHAG